MSPRRGVSRRPETHFSWTVIILSSCYRLFIVFFSFFYRVYIISRIAQDFGDHVLSFPEGLGIEGSFLFQYQNGRGFAT